MSSEKLKSHADWLQDRADNPNTVMPGSTEPRSIVDSKKLGEIARDIREFAEDVEDEASLSELHQRRFYCPECRADNWALNRHGDAYKCRNCGHIVTAEWIEDFAGTEKVEMRITPDYEYRDPKMGGTRVLWKAPHGEMIHAMVCVGGMLYVAVDTGVWEVDPETGDAEKLEPTPDLRREAAQHYQKLFEDAWGVAENVET